MKMNILKLNIVLLIIALLSISVGAFGISSSWYDGHPLILEPGETKDIHVTIQNGGARAEEVLASVELNSHRNDLVRLLDADNNYLIPAGGEARVNIRVTVPEDIDIGYTFAIDVSVRSSPRGREGVSLGSAVGSSIPVIIKYHEIPEEPILTTEDVKETQRDYNLLSIIGVLIIIAIVIFIFYELYYKQSGTESKKRGKKRS